MIKREQKFPEGIELIYTVLFGLSYFLDLYVYIGYKAVFLENKNGFLIDKVSIFFSKAQCDFFIKIETYTMAGLLFFFLAIVLSKYKVIIRTRSFFWAGLFTQILLALLIPIVVIDCNDGFYAVGFIYLTKFLMALTVSLNLCMYLSVIGRNIGRKKRTWTVVLLFVIGFLGPLFTSFFKSWNSPSWYYMVLPLLILCYAIYVFKATKGKDIFSNDEINDIKLDSDISHILKRNHFWKTAFMLFLCGLPVQYSVRFLLTSSEDFFTNKEISNNYVFIMRYLGSCVGILVLGYLSIYFSKRYWNLLGSQIRLGSRKVLYIVAILNAMIALFLLYNDVKIPYFIYFLIGVSNAIWCAIFLQSLETFGRKTQPVLVFLLPLFLRIFWDLFVKHDDLFNLIDFDMGKAEQHNLVLSGDIIKYLKGDTQHRMKIISLDIYLIILIIGLLVSTFWDDNFEGGNMLNAYDDNFSKNFASTIVDDNLRKNLSEISADTMRPEQMNTYIEEVSETVKKRLIDVFDTSLYYYSFTFLSENQETFISRVKINENALKDLKKVRAGSIRKLFKYLRTILNNKKQKGLASYSFEEKYEGLVLAGRTELITDQLRKSYEDGKYRIFDLSEITMPKNDKIIAFWKSLSTTEDIDFADENKLKLDLKPKFSIINEELRELHGKNSAAKSEKFNQDNFPTEIRRLLTLRALGTWCYPKNEYFIYIITPQSGTVKHNLKTSLLLAMAKPIPFEKLNELRQLLDDIMYQRALLMSRDSEAKNTISQMSHSLKTTLGYFQNRVSALGEVRNDAEKFEKRKEEITQIIQTSADTVTFKSKLVRYKYNKDEQKDKFLAINDGANIYNMIMDILKELHHSTPLFVESNTEEHEVALKKLLEDTIKNGLNIDKNICVLAIPIGFRILLLEILKNAYTYANAENPKVEIIWNKEETTLSVINNGKIKQSDLSFINENNNQNVTTKIGINTMRDIINFKYFNQAQLENGDNGKWKIFAKGKSETIEESIKQEVEFNLIITKSDIKNV